MRETKINQTITSLLIFVGSFIGAFIIGSLFLQPEKSNAVTGLGLVGDPTISLSTSSDTVEIQITPSPTGVLASGLHSLYATTNMPTGYNIALAMTPEASTLGQISGTINSPVALSNNTWGFAMNRVSSSTPSNTVINNFDSSYTTPVPASNSKWAGIPNGVIKNTTTSATSDTTTIYYGAKADMNIATGAYRSTVLYTALANSATLPSPSIISITPNTGTTTGGTAIQIVGTGFTANDQSITKAVHIDDVDCLNVSLSSNTPTSGQDTIYCTMPARSAGGASDITVVTWDSTTTLIGGYTYIAPTPVITAPAAGQIFAASTVNTPLTVTTNIPGLCYYGTATNPTTQMTTTGGTTHSATISGLANQSTNTYYVHCRAASGHAYGPSVGVTFYVMAATPSISISAPTAGQIFAASTTSTTLSVTTSLAATCYYGAAANPTTVMSSTGGTSHSQSISGLTNESTNTVYVRCRAGSGNTASNYGSASRTFYVQAATPAIPTRTPASGATVTTGSTRVTVISAGAVCTWGTTGATATTNASGTYRTTTVGTTHFIIPVSQGRAIRRPWLELAAGAIPVNPPPLKLATIFKPSPRQSVPPPGLEWLTQEIIELIGCKKWLMADVGC